MKKCVYPKKNCKKTRISPEIYKKKSNFGATTKQE